MTKKYVHDLTKYWERIRADTRPPIPPVRHSGSIILLAERGLELWDFFLSSERDSKELREMKQAYEGLRAEHARLAGQEAQLREECRQLWRVWMASRRLLRGHYWRAGRPRFKENKRLARAVMVMRQAFKNMRPEESPAEPFRIQRRNRGFIPFQKKGAT